MNLEPLLNPKSIAVIGASARKGSLGYEVLTMIRSLGYAGELHPVNPGYESIDDLKCHKTLDDIGKTVDLAYILLSAKRLEEQVDAVIRNGARAMIIVPNAVLEHDIHPPLAMRIREKVVEAGIPTMGDNAMGFYNYDIRLKACAFRSPADKSIGGITFISQSGSLFSSICHNDTQLKFNLAITTGKEMNVNVADYILYALKQPTTKVIGIYMETVRSPDRFRAALHKAAEKKVPIVVLKSGKSELGARFTVSHSGGEAGDDDVFNDMLRHYGVMRVDSIDEFANLLMLLSFHPIIPEGKAAVIADSGGERNLIADIADAIHFEFAEYSADTLQRLQEVQEFGQEAANPLDPWGTGIDYEITVANSLKVILGDGNSALGVLSLDLRDDNFMVNQYIDALQLALPEVSKPVVFMTNYTGIRRAESTAHFNDMGIPVLCGTRDSLKAINHWLSHKNFKLHK